MKQNKFFIVAATLGILLYGCAPASTKPYGLTTEWRVNPCGIDDPSPRLSWKVEAKNDVKDIQTVAWRIIASSSLAQLDADNGDIWDSGKIASPQSLSIPYKGKELSTSQRVFWKVKIWDSKGKESDWSNPAEFTTGVMKPSDWSAKWIGPAPETRPDADLSEAQWITAPKNDKGIVKLEKTFHFNGVKDGEFVEMIHTSNPMHIITINGKQCHRHTGHVHNWRYLHFRDITPWLVKGENKITVEIIKDILNPPTKKPYAFIARFNFPDGTKFVSDSSWTSPLGKVELLGEAKETSFGKELVMRAENASPAFEKKFTVKKPVASAVLHITGVGFYEASLNGKKIGKNVLDPSPTAYDHRVLYSTHRLDNDLKVGENQLNILVGHGWYDVRSFATWNFNVAPWRDFPRTIAQLEIVYADGEREIVITDKSWRQVKSPVGFDCIREGEVIGAHDPKMPNFDSQIIYASEVPAPKGQLMAQDCYPSKITRTLKPSSIKNLGGDTYMISFPENIAGWMHLTFKGQKKGDIITIRYDERVNNDLTPATYSARDGIHNITNPVGVKRTIDMHFHYPASYKVCAKDAGMQTDRYICSGVDGETYEPRFTYNGFQYVLVKGLRNTPNAEDITACIIRTAFPIIGSFNCSDETFNTLMKMGERAYISNFANGYPTDCPHREKNGWTGDASIASELAQYCFENTSAYEKWLRDLCDTQRDDGNVCCIVPTSGWGFRWGNGPAWDSALPVITWNLWNYRDNRNILNDMYEPLKRYLKYTATLANEDGLVKHGLGDWVPVNREHMPSTELTSSCFYYQALRIASEMAKVKGLIEEAKTYNDLALRTRKGINKKYYKGNGIYDNGGQTAQAFPLAHGIVEPSEYNAVAEKLIESVKKTNYHVDLGLLGTKYVFRMLSQIGRTDIAFKMLINPTAPSMVEWVQKGGTTLWEDWKDGSSRNHIMFGDFVAWAYQYLAGIRLPETAESTSAVQLVSSRGFKDFVIEPQIINDLTHVSASVESPYGKITSEWKRDGKKVTLNVTVPANTTATIKLPNHPIQKITSGKYTFTTVMP